MLSLSFGKISKYIYLLTLLALLIDIGGGFGIKYVLSGLLLVWALVLLAKYGVRSNLIIELGVLVFFLFCAWYAVVRGVGVANIYGQLSFVVYFFTLFVVRWLPRDLTADLFRKVVVLGAVIVIGTFLSILFFPGSKIVWNQIDETYRLGYLGVQDIAGETIPSVYYRWSMWLIPAFILSVGRHNASALVIGIAAVFTLSTSIIAATLVGMVLLNFAVRSQHAYSLKIATYLFVLMIAAVMISDTIHDVAGILFEQVTSKFSPGSESSSIKLGHIEGALQSMQGSAMNVLFGTGAGSEFYSPGIDDYTINIEVSHFNFVRQFGLIGGLMFFGYIFYVIVSAYQTDVLGKRWAIGLLMLFVAAGTNPLLMSPVFIVVLMAARASIERFHVERINAT